MTWLNSDDKFHPHAFFIVAAVLRQRPDVEWLTGRSNLYDEKGRQTYICEYLLPHSHAKYLHKKYANPWIQQEGTFWRRNLWDLSGAGVRSDLDFAGDLKYGCAFSEPAGCISLTRCWRVIGFNRTRRRACSWKNTARRPMRLLSVRESDIRMKAMTN